MEYIKNIERGSNDLKSYKHVIINIILEYKTVISQGFLAFYQTFIKYIIRPSDLYYLKDEDIYQNIKGR